MEETAYAKINLALHVRERRPDGYHRIETLFAFAEEGDLLRVAEGNGLSLTVEGPFAHAVAGDRDNLVLRAARALRERHAAGRGASLTLDKRLPVAAGLGGGSADAGAALRLLNRWWRLGLAESQLLELARPLGADVPACLLSRTCKGEGRGDILTPLDSRSGTPVLLVNPGVSLSTAEVFSRWQGADTGGNDLEPPAIGLAPVIGSVLEMLRRQSGAELVRMSGSGATCFALFGSEASRDRARDAMPPEWWRLASRLR
jgi:4-diphosphocytidyl-2-C-methyl-D-erythritol kinase